MKKRITFPTYKIGLALLLLSTGTFTFAQRRGGEHGAGRQQQARPSMPRIQGARPQGQANRSMMTPGAQARPRIERPHTGDRPVGAQRPSLNNRPSVQRPTINRPTPNPGAQITQRPQGTPNPGVRNSTSNVRPNDNRYNGNRYNSNRAGFDNRNRSSVYNNRINRPGINSYRGGNGHYYRPRPHYSRPPVVWQGRRYYTRYTYVYHPYRPYYYGSFFHPFGFYLGSLGASAIMFSWNNQYYGYDQGVYYAPYNEGYQVVPAPTGASINTLPSGYATLSVEDQTYYYFAGTFYIAGTNGFEIVPAPPTAVVYDLPEGAKEVKIGDITYLEYNNNYYQPISLDGRDGYEVVDIEDDTN